MWKKIYLLSATVVLLAASCSKPYPLPPKPSVWPVEAWGSSTPEEQGFDSGVFADALLMMREQQTPVHSLAIVRPGKLVLDANFYPYDGESVHQLASVTVLGRIDE